MSTTIEEISQWFDNGVELGRSHMLVVCDEMDHDDYPIYVQERKDVDKVKNMIHGKQMQKVMEIYDLSIDKEPQLQAHRAWYL